MTSKNHQSFAGTRRIMIFIDGQYLRKGLKKFVGTDKINYDNFTDELLTFTDYPELFPELIRVYYYDAIPRKEDAESMKYEEQINYLREILSNADYEIKLGRMKKLQDGTFRQKGVDVQIAIDMLTKAYLNHYDIAILVGGDDDFLDVVKAVKDTGKRVIGAFFNESVSETLAGNFDTVAVLEEDLDLENLKSKGKESDKN